MEVLERLASEHPDDHGGVRTDLIDMIGKKNSASAYSISFWTFSRKYWLKMTLN